MTGIVQTLIGGFGAVAAAVTDAYFNLVTLLLPGNGTNGAQNNTFLDSSTNNFTITRNGNTTQGTFSPFSQTGWGNYFNGSSDYLTLPSNSANFLHACSSDWTFETWFYTGATTESVLFSTASSTASSNIGFLVSVNNTNANDVACLIFNGTTSIRSYFRTGGGAWTSNNWNHVAITFNATGTVFAIYVNGVSQTLTSSGSGSFSASNASFQPAIGRAQAASPSAYFAGYVSNLRAVNGSRVYTANFTPPTAALSAITNTAFLTCQSNRFIDNSSNAFAITVNGTPSVQAFSPFLPTAAYSADTNGGSGYFDGTGDYVSAAGNAAFSFTGDFTIDGWIYQTAQSTQYYGLCSIGAYTNGVMIRVESSGGVWYLNPFVNSTTPTFPTAALKINLNTWYHVAVVRSGTTVTTYLNGTSAATMTVSGTVNSTNGGVNLGVNDLTQYWAGYVSGFRIIKGSAVVPSGVPTSPPTAVTNTQLLLNFTNAGITDATAKNDLETVGNAQISTAQSKFGGSSMYFDGTGDYLLLQGGQNFTFGTGDFTIEFWVYVNSGLNTDIVYYDGRPASTNGLYNIIYSNSTGKLVYNTNSADRITGTTTLSTGTWYHVALSRSGTSTKLFLNGTQEGSTYTDSNSYIIGTNRPVIGGNGFTLGNAPLNGYIDDLRVTKGYARYTANFTAPTAAFALQ